MSRHLAATLLMLTVAAAATSAAAAPAVTKCESDSDTLYTAAASCPSGYANVTGTMRGSVVTVPRSSPKARQDEQAYLAQQAQISSQIQNWDARDEELEWRALNTFWNQCRLLDYQAHATERAMYHTEYWSRADRYRDAVKAVRTLQYDMGCF
ncbi:hypothetical protein [Cupriavidus sp. BIS7]|uniref:hypothetical protein n=1 Tax=Cupriavidus sp. BIS7 TaxID=1217718 RepID=UPI00030D2B8E|nr:hypothetical protein [Cupriavidus sp. BIS7]